MIQAICWVLIHSLWQGLLFTVATGLVMLRTKKMPAALRYNLLQVLFFLFLATCGCTFLYEWRLSQLAGPVDLSKETPVAGSTLGTFIGTMNAWFTANASLIVLGWFLVFFSKCIRMTGSLIYTQRIRNYGTSAAPAGWNDKVQTFCRQLGIAKKVELMQSRLVKMPLVAGHWRPIILIPLGLLTKLPEGEIEAMLLHELAHIRRHDYLVNILQHIAENIFFFNPGLLWISALLREEREHCCDDMAIARTNNKIQFIQALINFKEHDLRAAGLANAFPARKNQLVHRVMRIAQNKNKTLNTGEKIFFLGSFLVVAFLLAAGGREGKVQAGGIHQMVMGKKDKIVISRNEAGLSLNEMRGYLRDEPVKATENKVTDDNKKIKVKPRAAIQKIVEPILPSGMEKELAWNDRAPMDPRQVSDERSQYEKDAAQAVLDRIQAERDRAQAVKDREQAQQDSRQAERDRAQAVKDREQAVKDREQAERDREQAEKDRHAADRDRAQAEKDRMQADIDRAEAEKKRAMMKTSPGQGPA